MCSISTYRQQRGQVIKCSRSLREARDKQAAGSLVSSQLCCQVEELSQQLAVPGSWSLLLTAEGVAKLFGHSSVVLPALLCDMEAVTAAPITTLFYTVA
jgi:hypothetical protein